MPVRGRGRGKRARGGKAKKAAKDDVYAVEKILDRRVDPSTSNVEYFLKWLGYGEEENSWVPEESVSQDLIDDFEKKNPGPANGNAKYHPQRILGIVKTDDRGLEMLVQYEDDNSEIIPAKKMNLIDPQLVIRYYEGILCWCPSPGPAEP